MLCQINSVRGRLRVLVSRECTIPPHEPTLQQEALKRSELDREALSNYTLLGTVEQMPQV